MLWKTLVDNVLYPQKSTVEDVNQQNLKTLELFSADVTYHMVSTLSWILHLFAHHVCFPHKNSRHPEQPRNQTIENNMSKANNATYMTYCNVPNSKLIQNKVLTLVLDPKTEICLVTNNLTHTWGFFFCSAWVMLDVWRSRAHASGIPWYEQSQPLALLYQTCLPEINWYENKRQLLQSNLL